LSTGHTSLCSTRAAADFCNELVYSTITHGKILHQLWVQLRLSLSVFFCSFCSTALNNQTWRIHKTLQGILQGRYAIQSDIFSQTRYKTRGWPSPKTSPPRYALSQQLSPQNPSTMSRTRRIMKELEDVRYDVSSGIHIQPVNESDLSHLKGTFRGPPGTPYEGGHFVVDIQIPVCIIRRMSMAGFL
jgi:hypothetical protein